MEQQVLFRASRSRFSRRQNRTKRLAMDALRSSRLRSCTVLEPRTHTRTCTCTCTYITSHLFSPQQVSYRHTLRSLYRQAALVASLFACLLLWTIQKTSYFYYVEKENRAKNSGTKNTQKELLRTLSFGRAPQVFKQCSLSSLSIALLHI